MKYSRLVVFLCTLLFISYQISYTQNLEETLQKLAEDAARGYVQPIVSGFGADLNSGWMYRAPEAKKFGFDLDFGFVAMGAFMSDEAKTFSKTSNFQFDQTTINLLTQNLSTVGGFRDSIRTRLLGHNFSVTFSGPTVVGSKTDSVKVSFSGGKIRVPYGTGDTLVDLTPAAQVLPVVGILEDLSLLPMFAPQLSIGTVFGTKATFRYLPDIEVSPEIGKFSYFGFGIQHNPFMFIPIPEPPLDVSLGFFTQTMKVGGVFKSTATLFGAQASKTFGPGAINVTPYAGISIESSSMTFTYDYKYIDPITLVEKVKPVEFELEGENSVRFTIGATLKLAFIKLNADYNIAKYNTISAGLGIII